MKKKIIIMLIAMSSLVRLVYATGFYEVRVPGNNLNVPLEIYGNWNPAKEPLFVLSANSQQINYVDEVNNSLAEPQYTEEDLDLSGVGQTSNFNLFVFSNFFYNENIYYHNTNKFNPFFKRYKLSIYYSKFFVPEQEMLFIENNYPQVNLILNDFVTNEFYEFGTSNSSTQERYIESGSVNENITIDYGTRSVPAIKHNYNITIPSGLHALNLIDFNFSWEDFTKPVYQQWDMEAYVRVEITSEN